MAIYLAETPEGPCVFSSAPRAIDYLTGGPGISGIPPMEVAHGVFIDITREEAIKRLRRGALIYLDYDTYVERTTAL